MDIWIFIEKKDADKKKKNPNIMRPGTKPKANIKSMFMAQAATGKRKADVSWCLFRHSFVELWLS